MTVTYVNDRIVIIPWSSGPNFRLSEESDRARYHHFNAKATSNSPVCPMCNRNLVLINRVSVAYGAPFLEHFPNSGYVRTTKILSCSCHEWIGIKILLGGKIRYYTLGESGL